MLGGAEFALARRSEGLDERGVGQIAQSVLGKDEVVARVDVAVVLDHQRIAARFAERAERRADAHPLGQRHVEELHEIVAHVAQHPVVEHLAHELAETARRDRPFGRPAAGRVGRHDARAASVRRVADLLDDGHELHVAAAQRFEKAVYLPSAAFAVAVDGGHGVEFDAVPSEPLHGGRHPCEGGAPALVAAAAVVDRRGAVERDAYQEAVVAQERAPVVVQQRAVGLQCVFDAFAAGMALLQRHGPAKEVEPGERRLAAVPDERYRVDPVAFDVLADVALEQRIVHLRFDARIDRLLVQIVAVGAIEVAARSDGFDHRREGARCLASGQLVESVVALLAAHGLIGRSRVSRPRGSGRRWRAPDRSAARPLRGSCPNVPAPRSRR